MVGSKQTKRWFEVTPGMMSNEEDQGDIYSVLVQSVSTIN